MRCKSRPCRRPIFTATRRRADATRPTRAITEQREHCSIGPTHVPALVPESDVTAHAASGVNKLALVLASGLDVFARATWAQGARGQRKQNGV